MHLRESQGSISNFQMESIFRSDSFLEMHPVTAHECLDSICHLLVRKLIMQGGIAPVLFAPHFEASTKASNFTSWFRIVHAVPWHQLADSAW